MDKSISAEMTTASERIDKESKVTGEDFRKILKDGTVNLNKSSIKNANEFETESVTVAGKMKTEAADKFVMAYQVMWSTRFRGNWVKEKIYRRVRLWNLKLCNEMVRL